MSQITNSYLMWIGQEHYGSIESYTDEALALGVSKRLPNVATAAALMEPGTVIFVAHDEGEYSECPDCVGVIENPERRKLQNEIDRIGAESDKLIDALQAATDADEVTEKARLQKLLDNRARKTTELQAQYDAEPETIEAGTGGHITLKDGSIWDHRKYNYWLHQPKRFSIKNVADTSMCATCGGTGRLPQGKVFGMFIPSAIEYILKPEDDEQVRKDMAAAGFRLVEVTAAEAEHKRGCGKRKPGGVYAVTDKGEVTAEAAKAAVKDLVDSGKLQPEAVELNGNFARFLVPVDIDCKRFRGLKKWSLDPRAEAEAEMILDAMA